MCPEIFEVVIIGNNSFNNLADANTAIFNNLAKKFNIESKCILIPYVSRDDINSYLTTADVFVSTSIAETFGVAVREAMLCGLPVIATKSGGVEDSINEITGIKVNIGDYTAIANSLLKIKNKEFKYDPQQIRNFVISQCGSEYFLNKMNSFYN
jgi:glycosyltransferase involved in cell wall biosynthesis